MKGIAKGSFGVSVWVGQGEACLVGWASLAFVSLRFATDSAMLAVFCLLMV